MSFVTSVDLRDFDVKQHSRKINGLYFFPTCGACPEQYDVYDEYERKVGYVRLRHGELTVRCPNVYSDPPILDTELGFEEGDGEFASEKIRTTYLMWCANHINEWIRKYGTDEKAG